jgi:phosphatidylglycerophosphatase A
MNIFHDSPIGRNQLTAKQIITDPVLFLAFGFGSGLAKKAPGTLGTAAAIPLYLLFSQTNIIVYSLITIAISLIGIPICGQAADRLGVHDFNGIVWDEIAGYLITMWLVPFSWPAIITGFILFRIFDIIKPWPIKWVDQKVKGGLGIMLDDILAALIAGMILWVLVSLGWL